jgi:hypothetical protein
MIGGILISLLCHRYDVGYCDCVVLDRRGTQIESTHAVAGLQQEINPVEDTDVDDLDQLPSTRSLDQIDDSLENPVSHS